MSSIPLSEANGSELSLDYEELGAGQLVIVIHGLPNADAFAADAGMPGISPAARSNGNVHPGPPSSALIAEAEAIHEATPYRPDLSTSLVLAAWRGQEARALELIAAAIDDATAENACCASAMADYARAVLYNGLARYERAVEAAHRASAHEDRAPIAWTLAELVEAAVRSGAVDTAVAAQRRIDERTQVAASNWALGIQAQSRALIADSRHADAYFREALARFGDSGADLQLARAQLLYGEWLRRERRRTDARDQLRAAYEMFSDIGASGFGERARRELLATGETVRQRTLETRDELTAQEAEVARLAANGHTNPEIGEQLFISARTVQYHLRKVFRKLAISSRRELVGALPTYLATR
jgi:DNA-binding CsgD family transcriptional regulator